MTELERPRHRVEWIEGVLLRVVCGVGVLEAARLVGRAEGHRLHAADFAEGYIEPSDN